MCNQTIFIWTLRAVALGLDAEDVLAMDTFDDFRTKKWTGTGGVNEMAVELHAEAQTEALKVCFKPL